MRAKRARAIRAPGARICPHRRGRRDVTEHRRDGAIAQNDHILLAVHRPRKELRAASRVKPETVIATAKASKYRLTPPRAATGTTLSIAKAPSRAPATGRRRLSRPRRVPGALAPTDCITRARRIAGASPHAGAHEGLASTQSGSGRAERTASSSPARCDVRCPQDVPRATAPGRNGGGPEQLQCVCSATRR
jgi:hypothetical protein